jgi:GPH family glycoside/pentoside/hexuronide:cation symporter
MNKSETHLRLTEKVAYALGDTASNLFWMTFMIYLMIFYTDVYGLSATAAGTMMLITRLWDAVNNPIMGIIADRTKTRWGRFRPYLLWGAAPFGLFGVLTFTTPDLGASGKLIYAYITFTLMMTIYTVVNLPYSALIGVITPNSDERTNLSTYRFIFAFIGGFTVQYLTMPLVDYFGQGDRAHGYQMTMIVYATMTTVLWLTTFALTKERVVPANDQTTSIKQDLRDLANNQPWITLSFVSFITMSYFAIRSNTTLYYFKYYVGSINQAQWFMLGASLSLMAGVFCTGWLDRRFHRARLYATISAIDGIMMGLLYIAEPSQWKLMYALNFIAHFFLGPSIVLIWAMYADVADYSEWKSGRRATGLVFSATVFAQKLGLALGGAAVGWLLGYYGFQANIQQAPETAQGIRSIMCLLPSVLATISAIAILFYPLDRYRMRQIEDDLKLLKSATA